jgi:hypothetical protein
MSKQISVAKKTNTMMPFRKTLLTRKTLFAGSIACAALAVSLPAQAMDFKFGEGFDTVDVQWNNHVTYGAMYRVQDANRSNTVPATMDQSTMFQQVIIPDGSGGFVVIDNPIYNPDFFADAAQSGRVANGNDGNYNMDELVSSRLGLLTELSVNYKNFGAFVRARAWYDDVYKNGEPEPAPVATYNHPDASAINEFNPATVDYLGSEIELLDTYVFASFRVNDRSLSVKLGKQVINWGESMAFSNSVNSAINPVDANAGTRAGVDLKEIFLPTEALYVQSSITDSINVQTFVQLKHRGTVLIPTGAYFSETDMLGAGGEYMFSGPSLIPRDDRTDEVSDSGQYGLAFSFITDGNAEYGLYYVNAHDKAPSLQSFGSNYRTWYAEDRKVFAGSFSTVIGDTNVSGELSYRPNAVVILDPSCVDLSALFAGTSGAALLPLNPHLTCTEHAPAEVTDAKYTQAQVSAVHVLGGSTYWDQLSIAAEAVAWKYLSIDQAYSDAKDEDLYVTNTASGLGSLVRVGLDYFNIMGGANLSVPLTWQYGWAGTNSRSNTREGASIFSIGAELTFPSNITASLVYTQYDGETEQADPTFYTLEDRDNVALSAKYSF